LPVPYQDVYACYSYAQQIEEDDPLDAALLNSRICDAPHHDANCFPHPLKRCHYKDPDINRRKGAGCDWIGADGAYGHCRGQDGAVYHNIITTYLNEPDDLIGDVQLAARLRASMPPVTRAPSGLPTVHPRRCGCSSDAADGGLASAALAALVALVARGRRRRGAADRAPGSSIAPAASRSG
jgi:MYXO-CTERM domain-containing protein